MIEDLIFLVVFAGAIFIGWRARKGDKKAEMAANVIVGTVNFVLRYLVFFLGAALLAGSWYYGNYM